MSRSRKKVPVVKDSGGGLKPILRRSYRRTVKQIVKHYRKTLDIYQCYGCECGEMDIDNWVMNNPYCLFSYNGHEPVIPLRDEIWNKWDTCDWRWSAWNMRHCDQYGRAYHSKKLRK